MRGCKGIKVGSRSDAVEMARIRGNVGCGYVGSSFSGSWCDRSMVVVVVEVSGGGGSEGEGSSNP